MANSNTKTVSSKLFIILAFLTKIRVGKIIAIKKLIKTLIFKIKRLRFFSSVLEHPVKDIHIVLIIREPTLEHSFS